jgi:hypothetical protein
MSFTAQTKDDAVAQYTRLSRSHDPNDKLFALGGLLQFLHDADHAFVLRCAQATDYEFLEKLIGSGTHASLEEEADVADVKMENGIHADGGQLNQLGCAVLGVFAKLDEMKGRDEIVQRIPMLIAVLQRQYPLSSPAKTDRRSEDEGRDTFDTLQSLATSSKGADLVLRSSCLQGLLKLLENPAKFTDEILSLIHTALDHASPTTHTLRPLKILSHQFATTKDAQLASSLLTFFTSQFATSSPPKSLHTPLYQGLRTLSLSNIDETTRTQTLILLSLLLTHLGPQFLFSPPSSETKPKQFALLTVRIASVGAQTGYGKFTTKMKEAERQGLVACTEILHVTTAWLLCSPDNDEMLQIGEVMVTPEETLQLQETLSAAFNQVSEFLRARCDEVKLVLDENGVVGGHVSIELLVQSAVKFVGGWLGEGGGSTDAETENLGLLEPLLSVCAKNHVERTTWAMRGIKGILLYSEDGSRELLSHKDDFIKLLSIILQLLPSREIPHEEMLMNREITGVFRIMIDEQPLLLTEKQIQQFPSAIVDHLSSERVDEDTWDARTDAALLGLEILLKIAEMDGTYDRRPLEKWRGTIRLLMAIQRSHETKDDLEFLAGALENMAL